MGNVNTKECTAVFIGHNECYGISSQDVELAIIKLIKCGVTVFLSGGQGGFDRLCAVCVNRLKNQYPQIKNCIVIPYLNFKIFDKDIFDEIIYPENFEKYHYKAAIPARNRFMVDSSAYAICYVNHGWGGAAKTFERAIKKNLTIINIGKNGGY